MPVYNAGDHLDAAVASILDQSYPAFELLIVDDGSDAPGATLIDSWARRDPRIRVLRNRSNLGVTRSLNIGLAAARGEFLARQDADDIALPRRLQAQVDFFDDHPHHVLVGCGCALMDEHGRTTTLDGLGWTDWELLLISLVRTPIVHSSAMFRLDPVRRQRIAYDEHFLWAEDFDLWVRMLALGRLGVVPEVLVRYRLHPGAISSRKRREQHRAMHEIALLHCFSRLPELGQYRLEVEAFFDLLYLQPIPAAQHIALAGDGAQALLAAFARSQGLTPAQRFRARRLCVRWLALGLLRSRAWTRPQALTPLLRRMPWLVGPGFAELVDFGVRRIQGHLMPPT